MKKILFIIVILISYSSCDIYDYENESPYQTETNNYGDENYLNTYSEYIDEGILDNEIIFISVK